LFLEDVLLCFSEKSEIKTEKSENKFAGKEKMPTFAIPNEKNGSS